MQPKKPNEKPKLRIDPELFLIFVFAGIITVLTIIISIHDMMK